MNTRRYDIDALRVLACYLQFPFHAGRIFDDEVYHLKAFTSVTEIGWLTAFLHTWRMPLFFFVAGWSAARMLARRDLKTFLHSRFRRLLPPLVVGILLAAPLIKYLELSHGLDLKPCGPATAAWFQETFWEHFLHYFSNLRRFNWSHLWFLIYLLLYSVLLLPLLLRIIAAPARQISGWGWLLVPLVGLTITEMALRPLFGDYPNLYRDWAGHLNYMQFFVIGALTARHPGCDLALARYGPLLGLAGIAAGILVALQVGPLEFRLALRPLAAWGCVAGLYGVLRHRVTSTPRLLSLADASIALYVLHHPILILVGVWVLTLPVGPWESFFLTVLLSLGLTQGLYIFLVQPWSWPRVMLGMAPRPRKRNTNSMDALSDETGKIYSHR